MGPGEVPGVDLELRLLDERLRGRIIGIEGRDLLLKSLVIDGDVAQRLRELISENFWILADDAQQRENRILVDAKLATEVVYLIDQDGRTDNATDFVIRDIIRSGN